jgi:hypothetical protein
VSAHSKFDGEYQDGIVYRDVNGATYGYRMIHCCPGDWPHIKEPITDIEAWLVYRAGTCLIALGPPFGPVVDLSVELLRGQNAFVPLEGLPG